MKLGSLDVCLQSPEVLTILVEQFNMPFEYRAPFLPRKQMTTVGHWCIGLIEAAAGIADASCGDRLSWKTSGSVNDLAAQA